MWKPEITMEEFIVDYCRKSHIDKAFYNERYVALPCDCGEDGCRGWASIRRNWDGIQHQLGFCLPVKKDLLAYFPTRQRSRELEL